MGSSDEALLAGLAAGDRDASAAFVRRFQRRAYGLARTIVGDGGTAEDVAQEAFVRAWRYAASYDARRGTVLTWLLTIVRNVACRSAPPPAARSRSISPQTSLPRSSSSTTPPPRAETGRSAITEREQLRQALAILPSEQRRALLLAAFFGRTAGGGGPGFEAIPLGTAKTSDPARRCLRGSGDWMEVADER